MELPMFSATMFTDLGLQIFLASLLITFLAGIIKGAVGFAMPLVMVSGLSSIMAPQLAIGAMILPVVASNALQTFRHGLAPVIGEARAVWRYLLVVSIFIVLTAQLLP
ncbi:MAG: sulfite exporter TauE/SafE family protein, partial [Pseudomonadota bacterium]